MSTVSWSGHEYGGDGDALGTFLALVESVPSPCIVVDEAGCVVEANPAAERTFGYDPSALRGESPPVESVEGVEGRAVESALVGREAVAGTRVVVRTASGSALQCRVWSQPLPFVREESLRTVLWFETVGPVLDAPGSIVEADALDALDDLFYVLSAEGRPLHWNATVKRVTGLTDDEIGAMTLGDFFADTDAEAVETAFREVVEERTRRTVEAAFVTADGLVPYEFSGVPLVADDGTVRVAGIGRDVSDRKELQAEIRENERRLSQLAASTEDVLWMFDADWEELLFVNDAFEGIWGQSTADLEENPRAFMDGIHPDDRDRVRDAMARVSAGEEVDIEYRVNPGEEFTRWVWVQAVPVFEDGDVVRVAGFARDVTERKERERRLSEQAEELTLLNRIVRHDIRNDLSIVVGWLSVLREEVPGDRRADFDRVMGAADHAVGLTYSLDELVAALTDEDDVSLATAKLSRHLTAEVERVRDLYPDADVSLLDDVPSVEVRASGILSAVFRNLLTNAIVHSDGPSPTVEVSVTETDDRVVVAVADDGPGVPDDRKSDVFDRGTCLAGNEGSGVGLYLVRRLVETYDGSVDVADNEPRGAVFSVELLKSDADGTGEGR